MTIESFVDKIDYLEFDSIKNKKLEDIIQYIRNKKIQRLYIVENAYPTFILDHETILDIFFKNLLHLTLYEYLTSINEYKLVILDANKHIIDTYNYLRKLKIMYAPVVKDNKLIGEVNFSTLSLKISYLAIKDNITNTFNEKYFNVLVDEYHEIDKEVGIIMIKVFDIEIYQSFYGYDFINKILKLFAKTIKSSIRDVDFLFRNENIFKILTFNNAEITMKIKNRIDKRLENIEVENIKIPYKIVATQIPEIETNILLAIEKLEKELIKR
ncbi:diguanylate cyclase [Caminibacter mediatlanticus TB-2]|uniref:Diguanylate cyclase n=1 Tax=Caminibacter mediatlanticus TB-2 TaxID=391592 RepID=A0AAI9AHX0_9BACT|nr:diguanylate cyclase [Caminibacter mediatlanticus]EDM24521.1 hypothetical protein CMTB2_03358 [Caminibacter mediatlanticus TB-2]QCT95166.1 diguanylate cyclase [Caminibacter mediatlanticus TB-2]